MSSEEFFRLSSLINRYTPPRNLEEYLFENELSLNDVVDLPPSPSTSSMSDFFSMSPSDVELDWSSLSDLRMPDTNVYPHRFPSPNLFCTSEDAHFSSTSVPDLRMTDTNIYSPLQSPDLFCMSEDNVLRITDFEPQPPKLIPLSFFMEPPPQVLDRSPEEEASTVVIIHSDACDGDVANLDDFIEEEPTVRQTVICWASKK